MQRVIYVNFIVLSSSFGHARMIVKEGSSPSFALSSQREESVYPERFEPVLKRN